MTGVPSGSVVKNLPTNAEDTGSVLIWEDSTRWGAISPCATATEPVLWSAELELLSPRANY